MATSSDIVLKLQALRQGSESDCLRNWCGEAMGEIERLREENERLRRSIGAALHHLRHRMPYVARDHLLASLAGGTLTPADAPPPAEGGDA